MYAGTEGKWKEIDAIWRENFDALVGSVAAGLGKPEENVRSEVEGDGGGVGDKGGKGWECPVLDEAKWPTRGDEDIVGPMVRDVAMEGTESASVSRRNSTKEKVKKFFKDIVGRS